MMEPSCALRARAVGDGTVRVVTRNLSFDVERQLGIDPAAAQPAALDLLVGALAAIGQCLEGPARERPAFAELIIGGLADRGVIARK